MYLPLKARNMNGDERRNEIESPDVVQTIQVAVDEIAAKAKTGRLMQERAAEAAQVLSEYKAERNAERAKTARLRALRLAKSDRQSRRDQTGYEKEASSRREIDGSMNSGPRVSYSSRTADRWQWRGNLCAVTQHLRWFDIWPVQVMWPCC